MRSVCGTQHAATHVGRAEAWSLRADECESAAGKVFWRRPRKAWSSCVLLLFWREGRARPLARPAGWAVGGQGRGAGGHNLYRDLKRRGAKCLTASRGSSVLIVPCFVAGDALHAAAPGLPEGRGQRPPPPPALAHHRHSREYPSVIRQRDRAAQVLSRWWCLPHRARGSRTREAHAVWMPCRCTRQPQHTKATMLSTRYGHVLYKKRERGN